MRFIIDAQLPPALARMLTERGHDAEHVADVGSIAAPDAEIWRYALEHDAALVTKDEDFADLVSLGRPAPVLVWVRLGSTTRRGLLDRFEPLLDQLITMVKQGERVIELR